MLSNLAKMYGSALFLISSKSNWLNKVVKHADLVSILQGGNDLDHLVLFCTAENN